MRSLGVVAFAAFFAVSALASDGATATGRLCMESLERCLQWPAQKASLDTDAEGKPFVYLPGDGKSATLGIIRGAVSGFDPGAMVGSRARLQVGGLDSPREPGSISIKVARTGSDDKWSITLSTEEAPRLREIQMPEGAYELHVSARNYLPRHFAIKTAVGKSASIGTVVLEPAPVMTGRVVTSEEGAPIPGAMILSGAGSLLAITDGAGRFEFSIDAASLSEIVVEAPGRATRRVPLASSETSDDFGDVPLAIAGSLLVKIDFIDSLREPIKALLINPSENKHQPVAETAIDEHQSQARFQAVEPGSYSVLIQGAEPLQRLSIDADIKPGELTETEASIRPATIQIRTLLGDEPLADASVGLRHSTGGWKTAVTTDHEGHYSGPIWQPGSFLTTVTARTLPVPHIAVEEIKAADSILELIVPDRRVIGRVLDKGSRKPIAGASVALHSRAASMTSSVRAETGAEGVYEFTAVRPGLHTVEASAPGYVRSSAIEFVLAEGDQKIERSIELDQGVSVPVRVVDRMNRPIPNAGITAVVDGRPVSGDVSDSGGVGTVAVPLGRPVTVYVFPQNGSFAAARLPVHDGSEEPQIRTIAVPPAEASLSIAARDTAGNPIGDVRYLLRFGGDFLPPSILARTALNDSSSPAGDVVLRLLPVGYYEIWPYRTDMEAATIMAVDGEAPLRLGLHVGPGSNRASFELRAKGVTPQPVVP